MYIVQFLASCASLFWTPAKDATVPNLVPAGPARAGQPVSLFTTYGTAPVAGLLFGLLELISRVLGNTSHYFKTDQVNLALYFNVATFVVSALTIFALREIPRRRGQISAPSVAKTIVEGWRYIGQTRVVRGIVIGMVGAFAAARRGRRARAGLCHRHPARRPGGLGRGLRRDLRRPGPRHVRRPAHPAGVQQAPPVRLVDRVRGDPAGPDRADPRPGGGHDPGRPARRVAPAWRTSPGTRSSAARWTTRPAAGRSRSCSRPCGSSCSP